MADPELRRALGLPSATLLVVGGIIGSGIFFTPAETASVLPGPLAVFAVWALGGLVALAGALTYAELGAMFPEAGGPYVYIRKAFGPLPAFLSGWMTLLLIGSGAIAAVSIAFAHYLKEFLPVDGVGGPAVAAILTIALLTITNVLGIRPGAAVVNALTIAKIAALAGLIAIGALRLGQVSPWPVSAPAPPPLLFGLCAAFVPVLFTVGGFQHLNMVAGEIRDPQRNVPRALTLGIVIVIAVYLGVVGVYLGALGRDGLARSPAPAVDTMLRLAGVAGARFITAAAMLSILGFLNVALLGNARVLFALGRDGAFLSFAARVHPRFQSPHVALLLLGGWAIVLLVATRAHLGPLLAGVVFADWISFGLGAASVLVLRRKAPEVARPYRVPWYPWLPGFFVACAVVGVVSAYVSAPGMSLVGTGMLGVGVLVYRASAARSTSGLSAAAAPEDAIPARRSRAERNSDEHHG
jgi:APA family basic amino acid/polyamine antiporter